MIAVGTLCLLVNGHELEGKTCTVVGPLANAFVLDSDGNNCYADVYAIETGVPCAWPFNGWAARPRELVPIAPPGLIKDDKHQTALHV